jgi:mono/diheme cytochrome c family protein
MPSHDTGTAAVAALVVILLAACSGPAGDPAVETLPAPLQKGRAIYLANCAACHGPSGEGMAGAFPPLAGSDYLQDNRESVIRGVLYGQQGPMVVNGESYNGVMPGFGHLTDADIAAAISYVFASWGNDVAPVSEDEVARLRAR